jgi:hypothetical protein
MPRKSVDGHKPVTRAYLVPCRVLGGKDAENRLKIAFQQAQAIAQHTVPYLAARLLSGKQGAAAKQDIKSLAPDLNSDTRDSIKSKIRSLLTGKKGKAILRGEARLPQIKSCPLHIKAAKVYNSQCRALRDTSARVRMPQGSYSETCDSPLGCESAARESISSSTPFVKGDTVPMQYPYSKKELIKKRGLSLIREGDEYFAVCDIFSKEPPLKLHILTKDLQKDKNGKNGYVQDLLNALETATQDPTPLGECELAWVPARGNRKKKILQLRLCYTKYVPVSQEQQDKLVLGIDIGYDFRTCVVINNGSDKEEHIWINELTVPFKSLRQYRQFAYKVRQLVCSQKPGGHGAKDRFRAFETIQRRFRNKEKDFARLWASRIIQIADKYGKGKKVLLRIEKMTGLGANPDAQFPYHLLRDCLAHKAEERGYTLEEVPGYYNSMTCSKCHTVNWTFTQKYRRENGYPDFTCPACGHTEDADLNAARNLASQDFASLRNKIEEQKELLSKQERELEDALFA